MPAGEHAFAMKQPIPPYLIALAVGDLRFQALGDRDGRVDRALAARCRRPRVCGPAAHARGGRAAWPVRIAGTATTCSSCRAPSPLAAWKTRASRSSRRRSSPAIAASSSVIVHELAHSWSGNLVTNATWDDFWLNEGFTTYLEHRLIEKLYGERRAQMEGAIAYEELVRTIKDLTEDGRADDTALRLNSPAAIRTRGSRTSRTRKAAGSSASWRSASAAPHSTHSCASISTRMRSRASTPQRFAPGCWSTGASRRAAVTADEIDAWIYRPGLPATMPKVAAGVFASVDKVASDWRAGRVATDELPAKDWIPQEWMRFLDEQPADLEDEKTCGAALHVRAGRGRQCRDRAELARARDSHRVRTGIPGPRAFPAEYRTLETGRDAVQRSFPHSIRARTRARIYAKAKPGYHASIREAVERLLYRSRGALFAGLGPSAYSPDSTGC